MFDTREPADAAVAGCSPVNVQLAVVDHPIKAWFQPLGTTIAPCIDKHRLNRYI